jgi:predicted acylesterase/phospholipase RssA
MSLNRRSFLTTAAAGTLAAVPAGASAAIQPSLPPGNRGLVLTGGINRGAYQAGWVCGIAAAAGLSDGQPLDFDIVTGASIGALNAYLVATAQYSKLRRVWYDVGGRDVLRLKTEFVPVIDSSSGVITRLLSGIGLLRGLTSDVAGILQTDPVLDFISAFTVPGEPVHIPMSFTATNLTLKRLEPFLLRGTSPNGIAKQKLVDGALATRSLIEPHVVTPDVLNRALFASAALPVLFDPVQIPRPGSTKLDQYVDGGLTDNVPMTFAGKVARQLQIVAVDPPQPKEATAPYTSASGVGTRVFSIMQQEIIKYAAELTYATNILLDPSLAQLQAESYDARLLPIKAEFMQPQQELPGKLGDFNDTQANVAMFEVGYRDAGRPLRLLTLQDIESL